MNEIVKMPVKARVVLERFKNCIVKSTISLTWTDFVTKRIDENGYINEATHMLLLKHANTAEESMGKDQVVVNIHQDLEGVHITAKSYYFTPAGFESLITDIYTAGLLEGRRNNLNAY